MNKCVEDKSSDKGNDGGNGVVTTDSILLSSGILGRREIHSSCWMESISDLKSLALFSLIYR